MPTLIYSSFFWGLECSKFCKCGMTNGLRGREGVKKSISKKSGDIFSIMSKTVNSLDDLFVYKPRSHKLGVVQPHEESTLDNVIKRNPAHNKSHDTLRN
jgi:hypothetical protein